MALYLYVEIQKHCSWIQQKIYSCHFYQNILKYKVKYLHKEKPLQYNNTYAE